MRKHLALLAALALALGTLTLGCQPKNDSGQSGTTGSSTSGGTTSGSTGTTGSGT